MGSIFKAAVEQKLKKLEKDRPWLAEKIGMNYQTLSGKFQRDSFDEESIFLIAHELRIDLNKLRDEAFLHTGVIALWKESEPEKIIAFKIDGDYYSSRRISTDNVEEAFDTVLVTAIGELLIYGMDISIIVEDLDIKPVRVASGFYISFDVEGEVYCVAFSSSKDRSSINIAIDEKLIVDHLEAYPIIMERYYKKHREYMEETPEQWETYKGGDDEIERVQAVSGRYYIDPVLEEDTITGYALSVPSEANSKDKRKVIKTFEGVHSAELAIEEANQCIKANLLSAEENNEND